MAEPQTTAFGLADRLRAETDPAHRSLEAAIGFDMHQPSRSVASAMLVDFYCVLQKLEPAMLALIPAELAEGRAKLDMLERDLRLLGVDPKTLSPPLNLWLPQSHAEAIGAFYVFEGSTLGGKIIGKSLRHLPDWPISGLCYFDPYGPETGAMWQAFKAYLNTMPASEGDVVIEAASRTFRLLEAQMAAETSA